MKTQNHHTLPEGWEMKKLGKLAKVSSGGTPNRDIPKYWNGNIPWITTSLIDLRRIRYSEEFISEEGLANSSAKIYPAGTLLMAMYGQGQTRGKIAVLEVPATTNQACAAIIVNDSLVDSNYLFQNLTARYNEIRNLSNAGTQENLNGEVIKGIPIPLPPLPEQRQIAAVLGTWDRAIEQTTDLLKAIRTRHRGLMQQLLTGKKRLPGFEGSFRHLEIGEVAQEVSVRNRHDKVLTVLSCTKYDGLVDSLSYFGRKIFSDDLTTYKIVSRGEFAYATNHIEEGSIGYQSAYDSALISPMYTVFKTDSTVYDPFLYFLLKTDRYIQEYKKNMVGSIDRRGGLRWNDFSKIIIPLPTTEEQRAIAHVLDASLNEIRQNEAKLDALRVQKRGLMQCLLTGQVRVPLPAETA